MRCITAVCFCLVTLAASLAFADATVATADTTATDEPRPAADMFIFFTRSFAFDLKGVQIGGVGARGHVGCYLDYKANFGTTSRFADGYSPEQAEAEGDPLLQRKRTDMLISFGPVAKVHPRLYVHTGIGVAVRSAIHERYDRDRELGLNGWYHHNEGESHANVLLDVGITYLPDDRLAIHLAYDSDPGTLSLGLGFGGIRVTEPAEKSSGSWYDTPIYIPPALH